MRYLIVLAAGAALTFASPTSAGTTNLPSDGSQVNNDPAAGIDPGQDIVDEEPATSDIAGGSLAPANPAVPWAIFRQQNSLAGQDQIFVRSFGNGAWVTQGNGTVGGLSSASPLLSGSLNFDQSAQAEGSSIDFAGSGRTVPWAAWYEHAAQFGGVEQVLASRFDAASAKWIFAGQRRGNATGMPSLNLNTSRAAENPAVAGGTTDAGQPPGPWITWQEIGVPSAADPAVQSQIFVAKPVPLADGVTTCPAGTEPAPAGPAIGGFCWQQVGIERTGTAANFPSLSIDPTRNAVEPDIAFTGPNDTVPWVVWYEQDPGLNGVTNKRVFAAKGVADASADGGFRWVAVGNGTGGQSFPLDRSGTNQFGPCAESKANSDRCSLNQNPDVLAQEARVAAGTMDPARPTEPWVIWQEAVGGVTRIFVSRLVGGDHFELVNSGQPLTLAGIGSTRPDITFAGNTPYVSWREQISPTEFRMFYGHFVDPANPTFVFDNPGGTSVSAPGLAANVRAPISSGCTATPFNGDGSACQGGAVGTPFFLFTDGLAGGRKLLARAYAPDSVETGEATSVKKSSAVLNGSINPGGAAVTARFEFGTTDKYGQSTPAQPIGVASAPTLFSATVSGLKPGATIHYRTVAETDFGASFGPDRTTGRPKLRLKLLDRRLTDVLEQGAMRLRTKMSQAGKVVLTATLLGAKGKQAKGTKLGRTKVRFRKAATKTVRIRLKGRARRALSRAETARVRINARATNTAGLKTSDKITHKLKR